jgi:hypothetical protein
MKDPLPDLAIRINEAHQAFEAAKKTSIEHAITAGKLLIKAKLEQNHGDWTAWLKKHCKISETTARLYMRLAKNPKTATGAVLTLRAAARSVARKKPDASKPGTVLKLVTLPPSEPLPKLLPPPELSPELSPRADLDLAWEDADAQRRFEFVQAHLADIKALLEQANSLDASAKSAQAAVSALLQMKG